MMKDKKINKFKVTLLVLEIVIAIGIALLLFLWDETTLSKGLAIISLNISALFVTAHFKNEINTTSLLDEIELETNSKLSKIEFEIKIEKVLKDAYQIKNEEQRKIYIESIKSFCSNMEDRINSSRSGSLTRQAYYTELHKAADLISEDYDKHPDNYKGEIWALTFWQDDELDFSDQLEEKWVKRMEEMDAKGIKTKRICVMKNKMRLLTSNTISDETVEFLNKLNYYCGSNPICKNTKTVALGEINTLSLEQEQWIGKGFFAIKLSTGELRLIRGVSLDNINSNTLGGEIDFDTNRIAGIRKIWEQLCNISATEITTFLERHCSEEVKQCFNDIKNP